jgi:predicted nucleotidyltransferase
MAKSPRELGAFLLALADVQRWLSSAKVPGVVIGGVATALLGRPRMTGDLDINILANEVDRATFIELGRQHGFRLRIPDPIGFARDTRMLLFVHVASTVPLDVSLGALEFERDMIENAQTLNINGVVVKVPRVEDLIVTKAVAGRDKDLADIEGLVAKNPKLDKAYLRRRAKEFAALMEQPDLPELFERYLGKPKRRRR